MKRLLLLSLIAFACDSPEETSDTGVRPDATADAGTADTGVEDTGTPDGGAPDTGAPDAGMMAFDLAGDWEITSLTSDTPSGVTTISADDVPRTLVGAVRITTATVATASVTHSFNVAFFGMPNGYPEGAPTAQSFPLGQEDDANVVIFSTGDDIPYDFTFESGVLTFTLDEDDPRAQNLGGGVPLAVTYRRLDTSASRIVGTWNLVSATDADGTMHTTGTCEMDGGDYVFTTATLTVNDLYRTRFDSIDRTFSDMGCVTQTGVTMNSNVGFVSESGDTLGLWIVNTEDPLNSGTFLEWTITETPPGLTLTRTDCLPDCTGGPMELVIAP